MESYDEVLNELDQKLKGIVSNIKFKNSEEVRNI